MFEIQNWILPIDKMQGTIKELLDALGLALHFNKQCKFEEAHIICNER